MALKIRVQGSSSAGNNYVLEDGDSSLMIEAGVRLKTILKKGVNLKPIKGLLVTHEHGDHSKYANDILLSSGFDIYASQGTLDQLGIKRRGHVLKSGEPKYIDNWIVIPFDVKHDVAEPLGFIIQSPSNENIVFLTDTVYSPVVFPKGITYWLVECNYSKEILRDNVKNGIVHPAVAKRVRNSHMSLDTCKEFFQVNNLEDTKEIILIHLSDKNSDATQFKNDIEKITKKTVRIA